jgi:hypothetical protein
MTLLVPAEPPRGGSASEAAWLQPWSWPRPSTSEQAQQTASLPPAVSHRHVAYSRPAASGAAQQRRSGDEQLAE